VMRAPGRAVAARTELRDLPSSSDPLQRAKSGGPRRHPAPIPAWRTLLWGHASYDDGLASREVDLVEGVRDARVVSSWATQGQVVGLVVAVTAIAGVSPAPPRRVSLPFPSMRLSWPARPFRVSVPASFVLAIMPYTLCLRHVPLDQGCSPEDSGESPFYASRWIGAGLQ
jgi:hypothetical protein